ncbi:hypothetical protein [Terracoccus luteus]|uniref:hypothetical protein n=1 Tax=Terracoccus luteus TaxID=53356 RepID=UPI001B861CDB|nr:hypothetical protein [Terracoccus luteus]
MPQSYDEHQKAPFGCVDLWVHIDDDGTLEAVLLEGRTLGETLAETGRPDDAMEAHGLVGRAAVDVAGRLGALVAVMLSSSAADPDGHPGGGGARGG